MARTGSGSRSRPTPARASRFPPPRRIPSRSRGRSPPTRCAASRYPVGVASESSVTVGNVRIGGGAPVVVQSMTLTKTHDVEATTAQIAALASAGCEVVRVAVPKTEDADALPKIVRFSPLPVIADIHFNASLALRAIDAKVAAVRINPGNIGGPDKLALLAGAAKKAGS